MTSAVLSPSPAVPAADPGAPARRHVVLTGSVALLWNLLGTAVAVVAGWPAQLGGAGDPDRVAAEFLTRGTALSAPLGPLLVLALAVLLASRRGRAGGVGTGLLVLLGVAFVVGGLGEALAPDSADVPRAVLVTSGAVAVGLALAVWTAAAGRVVAVRRARRATP